MRATAHQQIHTPSKQGIPVIQDTEEWGQEQDSDLVADRKAPLPGAILVQYHRKAGIIPRNIRQHPREHSVGI